MNLKKDINEEIAKKTLGMGFKSFLYYLESFRYEIESFRELTKLYKPEKQFIIGFRRYLASLRSRIHATKPNR